MKDYIIMKKNFSRLDIFSIYILIMIISGIIGFIYEEIFYYFDLGYLVKRGSTFGPWIPIYAFGGIFITFFSYRYRKKPFYAFIISLIVTTTLEFGTGMILDKVFHIRLWDYGKEILNFGNIGGYICFRSVFLFAIAGLFLIYSVIPIIFKIVSHFKSSKFNIFCLVLLMIFLLDMVIYSILK